MTQAATILTRAGPAGDQPLIRVVFHPGALDGQLTSSIASLPGCRLMTLETVAQDGMRVRAAADREQSLAQAPATMNKVEKMLPPGSRKSGRAGPTTT